MLKGSPSPPKKKEARANDAQINKLEWFLIYTFAEIAHRRPNNVRVPHLRRPGEVPVGFSAEPSPSLRAEVEMESAKAMASTPP